MNEPSRDILDDVRHDEALSHEPAPVVSKAAGRVEIAISTLLRVGVIGSIAVILLGMAISFARHSAELRDPGELSRLTSRDADFPHSLREVFDGVLHGHGQAIVVAGLLLLIITPVLRVAVSIIAFAVQRDGLYVAITCSVLALLILSFLLGHAHG